VLAGRGFGLLCQQLAESLPGAPPFFLAALWRAASDPLDSPRTYLLSWNQDDLGYVCESVTDWTGPHLFRARGSVDRDSLVFTTRLLHDLHPPHRSWRTAARLHTATIIHNNVKILCVREKFLVRNALKECLGCAAGRSARKDLEETTSRSPLPLRERVIPAPVPSWCKREINRVLTKLSQPAYAVGE
jgi:hypothetical protein